MGELLLARTNDARQASVVHAVIPVPKWLAQINTAAKNFDFLARACRGIGWEKVVVYFWIEILIMTVLEDRFEDVLANIAH
jgi:hypothetical protein